MRGPASASLHPSPAPYPPARIRPQIRYEELQADLPGTLTRLFSHLGRTYQPPSADDTGGVALTKMTPEDLRGAVENFEQVSRVLAAGPPCLVRAGESCESGK